jgi:F0F1-type ATP synthase membrane subunit b/b'
MARKIFSGVLIVLSVLFLLLSVVGIGALWVYNEPLTREVTGRLKEVDTQLQQVQTTLASSEKELQRALRIVDAAQASLEKLTQQTQSAKGLFDSIQSTLDDKLLPELKTTRDRITAARTTLENLQSLLEKVRGLVPGLDLTLPDNILSDLIASTKSLDTEIANVEGVAKQASTFVSDSSYLLGGDLTETRASLQNFLGSVQDYEKRVAGWRQQDQQLIAGAPGWIDEASIALTLFLLWFALSQFGLLLHGLNIRAGGDPLQVLRRQPKDTTIPPEEDIDLELEA